MPIDEDDQIPRKFYSRLDSTVDPSKLKDLVAYSGYRPVIEKQENINILDKLARNIKLIKYEYSGNHKKRCRDVNHWYNEQIKAYNVENRASTLSDATMIFNDVKWNTGNEERVCIIKEKTYSSENAKLIKELDDYCEIRDNIRCNIFKNDEECLKYNEYINKRKQDIRIKMQNICRSTDCTGNDYTIDANCSLNNIDLTFREINCKGLYKKEESQETVHIIKERSPLEIGFFIIVSFILFYLFILFLEKFTPVGSIISRFRRRKYDLKRIFEREDDDRYSLYHSEKIPADSENKRYYIEYARPHN
ncbi:VIR protein [Plasmodium vivax]|uniref:VIR protein n=1 Tax=Plasmodium vivax TaxID=5855 RepID=A0A1G4E109_PLAVI|nr:VIR protein [Plasmodium vivax]